MTRPALPDILATIVARRRARYGLATASDEKHEKGSREEKSREEKRRSSIEGGGQGGGRGEGGALVAGEKVVRSISAGEAAPPGHGRSDLELFPSMEPLSPMGEDAPRSPRSIDGKLLTSLEVLSPEAIDVADRQNPFSAALCARRGAAVIAEVKMGSPRLGSLVGRFDPERQAEAYARAGAAALSVVVEPDFFFGSHDLLARCRAASGLPAIAKDFVVAPAQLDEARAAGADAVLLIAALYSRDELARWGEEARSRGLVPLVETHDERDLDLLSDARWELVGVNNRDLRTFEVSLERSIALRSRLPAGALAVAESAIHTRADVLRLREAGFDAFLVGEALLVSGDPGAKLAELLGREGG